MQHSAAGSSTGQAVAQNTSYKQGQPAIPTFHKKIQSLNLSTDESDSSRHQLRPTALPRVPSPAPSANPNASKTSVTVGDSNSKHPMTHYHVSFVFYVFPAIL